jgi:hypothetical protein
MKIRPVGAQLFHAERRTDGQAWRRYSSLFAILRPKIRTLKSSDINFLGTNINLTIQRPSPHRTVNTPCFGYKNPSVDVVQGNNKQSVQNKDVKSQRGHNVEWSDQYDWRIMVRFSSGGRISDFSKASRPAPGPTQPSGGYTLVTLPRTVTPYCDSVDGTRDHVTYQKLVTR